MIFLIAAMLAAPINLAATCDQQTFTVKWDPVPEAESYYLRVNYVPNDTITSWLITEPPDFNRDQYTATIFTGFVMSGGKYEWWVHSYNRAED